MRSSFYVLKHHFFFSAGRRTSELLESALGKTLFIDEAYDLHPSK